MKLQELLDQAVAEAQIMDEVLSELKSENTRLAHENGDQCDRIHALEEAHKTLVAHNELLISERDAAEARVQELEVTLARMRGEAA